MNSIQQYLAALATSTIILSLNSCTVPTANTRESLSPIPLPVATSVGNASTPKLPQPAIKPQVTTKAVTATIYQVDSQCQALIPQTVNLPAAQSLKAAVATVLEQQSTSDLNLAYRVQRERNSGIVSIDLRVPANSPRKLTSLSSCEQLALFGSLRQTLTSNPLWKVKNVRFTELGKEIWL